MGLAVHRSGSFGARGWGASRRHRLPVGFGESGRRLGAEFTAPRCGAAAAAGC
eukprot:ctg_512.g229